MSAQAFTTCVGGSAKQSLPQAHTPAPFAAESSPAFWATCSSSRPPGVTRKRQCRFEGEHAHEVGGLAGGDVVVLNAPKRGSTRLATCVECP